MIADAPSEEKGAAMPDMGGMGGIWCNRAALKP